MTAPTLARGDDDDVVDIVDFSLPVSRIAFKIDDDIFEAHAALGLATMQDIVKVTRTLGDVGRDGDYTPLLNIFNRLLTAETAPRFAERVMSSGSDALDVRKQLIPILHFLLERYGLRPTQPSSDSSTGSPSGTGGTTSTPGFSIADTTSPS